MITSFRRHRLFATSIVALGIALAQNPSLAMNTGADTRSESRGSGQWTLVWSDEFKKAGRPDPAKWEFETGGGGWGNKDLENYTDRPQNARVRNGRLIIEARRENFGDEAYTSARLRTKGLSLKYGRVEVRAKVPGGRGTWPAIWMLADKTTYSTALWPDNGEFDILEHVGRDPEQILSCFYTKHYNWMNANGLVQFRAQPDAVGKFHVYALEWDENRASIEVDGVVYNVYENPHTGWEDWPFDQEYHLTLNMAVGGFGGDPDPEAFPREFVIDYVRVFKKVPSR